VGLGGARLAEAETRRCLMVQGRNGPRSCRAGSSCTEADASVPWSADKELIALGWGTGTSLTNHKSIRPSLHAHEHTHIHIHTHTHHA
jgi:hypothetical protein